jgi:hypothetical protein
MIGLLKTLLLMAGIALLAPEGAAFDMVSLGMGIGEGVLVRWREDG